VVVLAECEALTAWELRKARRMRKLKLIARGLAELPPEIGQLKNLKLLVLSGNQLSTLPPEIGQLTDLEALVLSGNQLSTLPPEIGQLTDLKTLELCGNQLSVLPPEIGQLIDLRRLDIANNLLITLPPQLGALLIRYPGLRIHRDGNPFRGRIGKLSRRDLSAYLQRRDKSERKEVARDRWSSQDSRTFIITVAGTFIANIVTLLYVGLALILAHKKGSSAKELAINITVQLFVLPASASLAIYFIVPKSQRRRYWQQIVLPLVGIALLAALFGSGKQQALNKL